MELNGRWFIDPKTKRTVLFKGINLGAGTKLPVGVTSHERDGYWVDHDRHVSFVGRPFPLNEADEHLQRLVNFGFNLLRFVVTWEAIEHEGPGIYDHEYLDYVVELLKKCKQYRFKVFIDPHQDCWSRHCGGSGHPGWTLLLAGLNPLEFPDTQAALVHNLYPEPQKFPKMIWNTNYQKLAAATLFTLFFAGKTYAPKCIVNGVHVQDYLQQHYFKSIEQLVLKIHANQLDDQVVVGYDTMNEPGQGYLPFRRLDRSLEDDTDFKMGFMPTPFQGMLLGSGIPTRVAYYEFKWNGPQKTGDVLVDPGDHNAWLTDTQLESVDKTFGWQREWPSGCIWATHGIWDIRTHQLLLPNHFAMDPETGEPTKYIHHWMMHVQEYVKMIRKVHRDALLFVQPPVLEVPPMMPGHLERLVYAPHWYDGLTLVKKKWCNYNVDFINLQRGKYGSGPLRFLRAFRVGEKAIRQCFVDQLETMRNEGYTNIGAYPCVMGEIGIPYDMNVNNSNTVLDANMLVVCLVACWQWILSLVKMTAQSTGMQAPESSQNRAMDANINALEKNLMNYTLWQYQPDNSQAWGDLWNGEDLSIWQSKPKAPSYENVLPSTSTSSATGDTLVVTPSSTLDDVKKPWKDDTYLDRTSNNSTDSFQGLLQRQPQQQQQDMNVRDLVCLYRPHPFVTAGVPMSMDFVSPTANLKAKFEYTVEYHGEEGTTEIHIPNRFFPVDSVQVCVSVGEWKVKRQFVQYWILEWDINAPYEIQEVKISVEGVQSN